MGDILIVLIFLGEMMKDYKIIYKILKMLDKYAGCENFEYELISAQKMKTTFEKWEQLLILLQKEGYIDGIIYTQTLSEKFPHIAEPIRPNITLKGIEFLENNSVMNRIKEDLKLVGEFI